MSKPVRTDQSGTIVVLGFKVTMDETVTKSSKPPLKQFTLHHDFRHLRRLVRRA